MTANDLVLAFEVLVGLCVASLLVFNLWPTQLLDSFRQEMFVVRDALFDYAASGGISFNDPAYRLLRRSMNGFIRYGHQLTFFRIVMTTLNRKVYGTTVVPDWHVRWVEALKDISDPAVKRELERFHTEALILVTKRVVLGSPVLMALTVFLAINQVLSLGVSNVRDKLRLNRGVRYVSVKFVQIVDRVLDLQAVEEDAVSYA